jgi:hypothetical protein
MNDPKKMLTRRALLLNASAGVMTVSLHAGEQTPTTSRRPSTERDRFRIRALDRLYDLHPKGCTLLAIEVAGWPGNEFGLWLPETVYVLGKVVWGTGGTMRTRSSSRTRAVIGLRIEHSTSSQ